MKFKKIGIIGGMGPESTALLYKHIIELCQTKFNSFHDGDFPEIIIYNLPIPDITKPITRDQEVKKQLHKALSLFQFAHVDFIAFPCNTLSYFVDYLKSKSQIPIIDIVEETARYIKSLNIDCVVLFGTETTIRKNVYARYLKNMKIRKPKDQREIINLIYRVMKGKGTSRELNTLIGEYTKKNHLLFSGVRIFLFYLKRLNLNMLLIH